MIKKWFAVWCGLISGALTVSCDMMHDETEDCPTGLYLSFKYDYNLQRADMFNDHVGAVSVYVFDETGHYVTCREVKNEGTTGLWPTRFMPCTWTWHRAVTNFWYWQGNVVMTTCLLQTVPAF